MLGMIVIPLGGLVSAITPLRVDSGHLTPRGEPCCNQTFNKTETTWRAFCVKCGAEVAIVGSKTLTASLYPCQP